MKEKKDHPGVYVAPPLFYVLTFLLSVLIQRYVPINRAFFQSTATGILAKIFIASALLLILPALLKFLLTRNTVITIKPANSLQTQGIYHISRNPMYLGLLVLYTGIALLIGNWWTVILIPFLVAIITKFVILKEEKYLHRAFGEDYETYKKNVRRWI